jgi:hypothetical protein
MSGLREARRVAQMAPDGPPEQLGVDDPDADPAPARRIGAGQASPTAANPSRPGCRRPLSKRIGHADVAFTVKHLSGARSPARAAIVHPLRLGTWLITAAAYLPACSHGSVRAKHGRSNSSSSARFRRASAAPILAAAAAFDSVVLTNA